MKKQAELCPICNIVLTEDNISRKFWQDDQPIRLDYAGRKICQQCAHWIDHTEWD